MIVELTKQFSEREILRDKLKAILASLVETRQRLEAQLVQKKAIAPPPIQPE